MTRVRILRRRPVPDPQDPEKPEGATAVTYSTHDVPPRIVIVAGREPSEEEIREAIRADLTRREEERAVELEV